ncbi:MAG: hypothetical protein QW303_03255 [Nitrososphaerota archaeon]
MIDKIKTISILNNWRNYVDNVSPISLNSFIILCRQNKIDIPKLLCRHKLVNINNSWELCLVYRHKKPNYYWTYSCKIVKVWRIAKKYPDHMVWRYLTLSQIKKLDRIKYNYVLNNPPIYKYVWRQTKYLGVKHHSQLFSVENNFYPQNI